MCPLLYQLTVEFHRLRVQIQMQMYPVGLASREEGGRVAGGRGCGGSAPSCSVMCSCVWCDFLDGFS